MLIWPGMTIIGVLPLAVEILKTNLTVLKLHSSWWLNSHNKHYKFSSVCFSLPLGQIIVIDNLGPCVTDSRGKTFLVIILLRPCWCVVGGPTALPPHQNVLKFRESEMCHQPGLRLGTWPNIYPGHARPRQGTPALQAGVS